MEPFIGQIQAFGFNYAPRGWAKCDGQLLPIASFSAVFSLLGTAYGGDGRTTFGLPDLRGRAPVGAGNGPGLDNISMGQKGGNFQTILSAANIPPHNHEVSIPVSTEPGEEAAPNGQVIADHSTAFNEDASAGSALKPFNSANSGSGQAFPSRSPFQGVNYSIALEGIFPPRS